MDDSDFFDRLDQFPTVLESGTSYLIEAPYGWQPIVLSLLSRLEDHAKQSLPDLRVDQIKQKYGHLRVYVTATDEKVEQIIAEAEKRCAATCEVCGQEGRASTFGSWITVVCVDHRVMSNV